MSDVIRLLLADDHAMFRAGIKALLEAEPRLEVIGEAATGDEAVEAVRSLRPEVVVMDLSMPGSNGLEATRRIRELERNNNNGSRAVIVALTAHQQGGIREQVQTAGMDAFLAKPIAMPRLMDVFARSAE